MEKPVIHIPRYSEVKKKKKNNYILTNVNIYGWGLTTQTDKTQNTLIGIKKSISSS